MKLAKSLLLGSAATLVVVAGASAADLPSKKAAPVNYVKVCDAYGAGFFYIPGTDTCIKVGGRVRADYAMSGQQSIYGTAGYLADGTNVNVVSIDGGSSHMYGLEARGRVDLDARTQTGYGTVQAVASLRLARTTGILAEVGPLLSSNSASSTLEAAYIRFAGFTFGAARDNFSFMPSTFYGAGHWASFANGAKQIAYTAILGGGFSATLAIQDAADTSLGFANAAGYLNGTGVYTAGAASASYSFNNLPQINARFDLDQAWGSASLMGAVGQAVAVNALGTYDANETVWAIGAGLKINLPMVAAGDVLYLNAAYADGMTEYTVNWLYNKSSDTRRNTGGFYTEGRSWVNTFGIDGKAARVETLKSWNIAGLYTHYWTPEWRHSFLASYGQIEGTSLTKAITFGTAGAFGDATTWNIGTQLAWLPVRNFEIGVDILYNRVDQDVRRALGTVDGTGKFTATSGAGAATKVTGEGEGNWSGRLRVERTF